MRLVPIILLFQLVPLVSAQVPVCKPLADDSILARDLASVLPAFQQVPSDTVLAATPAPGSQRVFHSSELQSLAKRYSIQIEPDASVCFERAMEPLDRGRVLEAMQAAWQNPDAHIELVEMSLYRVPHGKVEFTRERLGSPASPDQRAPVLWPADVLYGESHRFAIWARVRIKVPCSQVVAAESLMPGRPLEALQLRVATGQCFPNLSGGKISPDSLVGLLPLHPIAAGSPVRPELLTRPNDINRGDLVEVEVRSRAVHLVFSGRADSAGRGGDTIAVRNLVTNRIFAAQVISKGKAIVFPDANKTIE